MKVKVIAGSCPDDGDENVELFYQDGANGWKSLGRKKGVEPRLVYDNVPGNVLLWLRNLTTGKEEQVFIMKDGKQLFVGKIG